MVPENQDSLKDDQMRQNAGAGGGRRPGALAVAAAGIALLVTGCGGSSGASTAGSAGSTAGPATYAQMAAYSECMQSHGAPAFPNPAKGPGGGYGYPMTPQTSSQLTGPPRRAPGTGR